MSNQVPETRQLILKTALNLFETLDRPDVRLSDIAKAAGLSRQTVYLYFRTRADLLIAITYYVDEISDGEARLEASRTARTGVRRLSAFVEAWTDYIPEIYHIARALLALNDADATAAWTLRMQDMWEGCEAAIKALKRDGQLQAGFSVNTASDLLWTILSVRNWEHLRIDRGWSQKKYQDHIQSLTRRVFIDNTG